MTNRIFRAIFLVAAAVMLAVSLLTMGMMYQFSAEETTEKLQRETEYIACGIETDGVRYLEKIKDAETRITWVDADGTVLYDSSADASEMENHSDREEIKEAMQSGEGNSKRISATLSGQTLYHAERLTDGTILRLSVETMSVVAVFLTMANQEREVLGLSNPVVHDTDMAVRVGVEALKKLIAQDRMTKL